MTGINAMEHGEIEVNIDKLREDYSIDLDWMLEKRKNGVNELTDAEISKTSGEIEELFELMEDTSEDSVLKDAPTEEDVEYINKELVKLRKKGFR